jgi:CheY-like chemotaxis protein
VLVVEDNGINMEVTKGILHEFGVMAEEAYHGRHAIEILRQGAHRFDAVLLDIQMPEMDGYEVSRMVRKELHELEVPIIAMTAHVGVEEKIRCLNAGMNDHVPKPIEPRMLMTALSEWIEPREVQEENAAERILERHATKAAEAISTMDPIPGINVFAAMRRLSGNRALFRKLLSDFCNDYADAAVEIRRAIESHDIARAQRIAHIVRGASGNLSITAVHKISASVEGAINHREDSAIGPLLDQLAHAIKSIVAEVSSQEKRFTSVEESDSSFEDKHEEIGKEAILEDVYVLLAKRNIKARRLFGTLKNQEYGEAVSVYLAQCENALKKLDFHSAQRQIEAIARVWGVKLPSEETEHEKSDHSHC